MSSQTGFDRVIQSQVDLMRLSGVDQKKIFKILNNLEKELKKVIVDIDPNKPKLTKWKTERLKKLEVETTKIINNHYKEINAVNKNDLFEMSKWESVNSVGILNEYIGVRIAGITFTDRQLSTLVNNSMIDGRLIGDWWKDQSEGFQKKFMGSMNEISNQFQMGYLKGESLGEMIKTVSGVGERTGLMNNPKRDAEALVRTSYQQIAQEVRLGTYQGNDDIIGNLKIIATLDSRTCFIGDTNILTPEGYKKIKDLKKNGYIIAPSCKKRKIKETLMSKTDKLIEIELENGKILYCTPDHLFLTKDGEWIEAQNLNNNIQLAELGGS